uniref:Uncharacterized protein n=1 Tax=Tanacetum cinerariifolium TaxID=118510 RepID=A0A6L2MI99_TANCI|nr:hypothetical protein [Tanacetum cinerariifolium]
MVAYVEKSTENVDFAKIVYFLNASHISMASAIICLAKNKKFNFSKLIFGEDETVYEERRDRVERAATTASSLEAEQDNGDILRTQSMEILNESIPYGTHSEDAETQGRHGQDTEVNTSSIPITTASINITTAEPVSTINTPVTTAGVSVSTVEPSTPLTTTTTLIKDEDLIIAQTLIRGVIMNEPKAQMQAELEEERLVRQKEEEANIALIESWDNTQAMMDADY